MASGDRYADEYMQGGTGAVLCRDKVVARKMQLATLLPALWCGGGAIAAFLGLASGASPTVGAVLVGFTAFFLFLWATLSVVRTVVSEGEIYVQYGLWGPRVPIERVRSCRVVDYDWTEFIGWGIKRSGDGTWAYVITNGKVVELIWEEANGEQKRALFSASDPVEVVAAVQKARDGAARQRVAEAVARRVRVADSEELPGESEAEVQRELETNVAGARREKD